VESLAAAGVPAGVLAAPMIPGLNDAELETILSAAARAGAHSAGYVLLRLPHELRALFTSWLEAHYPERAAKVLALIRQTRAGALNDARFGSRFSGTGTYAELLAKRFAIATTRLGLKNPFGGLDCTRFRVPPRGAPAGEARQLALL
jgi:DNA repair photolyase